MAGALTEALTEELNFAFLTKDSKNRRFGVIPRKKEGRFDLESTKVCEIINPETGQYITMIGPKRSEIIEMYREAVRNAA